MCLAAQTWLQAPPGERWRDSAGSPLGTPGWGTPGDQEAVPPPAGLTSCHPLLSWCRDPRPGIQRPRGSWTAKSSPLAVFNLEGMHLIFANKPGKVSKSGEGAWPDRISLDLSRKFKLLLKPRAKDKGQSAGLCPRMQAEPRDERAAGGAERLCNVLTCPRCEQTAGAGLARLPASAGQPGPVLAAQVLFREQRNRNTVDLDAEKRNEGGTPCQWRGSRLLGSWGPSLMLAPKLLTDPRVGRSPDFSPKLMNGNLVLNLFF